MFIKPFSLLKASAAETNLLDGLTIGLGTGWAVSGTGYARDGGISTASYLFVSTGLGALYTEGATYRLSGTMSDFVAGYIQFYINSTSSGGYSGNGAFSRDVVCPASPANTQNFLRAVSFEGNAQFKVDNLSITYVSGP